jgi:NAD(P)H-hydrate epimerase
VAEDARASVLSRADVRALDAFTIRRGIASSDLMERAGEALADYVEEATHGDSDDAPRVLILCGSGNNGGDGFVLARLLETRGWSVKVALCGSEPREGSDAHENWMRWRRSGEEVGDRSTALALLSVASAAGLRPSFDVIVDALFGTGLDRPLDSRSIELIRAIGDSGVPVIAVDLPSGLDADTGLPLGAAVRAEATATLGAAKPGLFVGKGPDYAGRVSVLDIGLARPDEAGLEAVGTVLDATTVAPLLPERPGTTHKGDVGHVLVCGGSSGKSGAVLLGARAALRSGAGLVTMALPATLAPAADVALWEAMTIGLADDGHGNVADRAYAGIASATVRFSVAAIGPGLGTSEAARALVDAMIEGFDGALVLDADALNVLAGREATARAFAERAAAGRGAVVLTPHPGEMGRLLGTTAAAVQADRIGSIRACVARFPGATVVLKGAATLVGNAKGLRFNTSGNPGMASPGMGDVLAGTLAALLAVVDEPLDAASIAVFAHGLAADLLAAETESAGFFASEVADAIPSAMREIRSASGTR